MYKHKTVCNVGVVSCNSNDFHIKLNYLYVFDLLWIYLLIVMFYFHPFLTEAGSCCLCYRTTGIIDKELEGVLPIK